MRIGFDAKRAEANRSGLGNYARTLLINLSRFAPEHVYIYYTPFLKEHSALAAIARKSEAEIVVPRGAWRLFKSAWRSLGISRSAVQSRLDIFHGLTGELPLRTNKKTSYVVTVHDLIFYRFPNLYRPIDRFIYDAKLRHAVKVANLIVAISEQTKKDLVTYLGADNKKIEVIYQSYSAHFEHQPTEHDLSGISLRYKLPSAYLLCVATFEERKNQLLILKAIAILAKKNVRLPLVLVGKVTSYYSALRDYVANNDLSLQVLFLDGVPNEDLPPIYHRASLFLYPSLFEGFGIPIVEALLSGTPVITSRGSCFSEAGGPGSSYVDPHNAAELAAEIERLYFDESKKVKMAAEGRIFAKRFSPQPTTEQLMAAYHHVLSQTSIQ